MTSHKYLEKTRIFFFDSFIFDTNYLYYASKYLSINTDQKNIYPYQLEELGLTNNFSSYFLYLHFLFCVILTSVITIIYESKNLSENELTSLLGSFLTNFSFVMENYIFISENINLPKSFEQTNQIFINYII